MFLEVIKSILNAIVVNILIFFQVILRTSKKEKCYGKKIAYMIKKVVNEIELAKSIRESDGTYSA